MPVLMITFDNKNLILFTLLGDNILLFYKLFEKEQKNYLLLNQDIFYHMLIKVINNILHMKNTFKKTYWWFPRKTVWIKRYFIVISSIQFFNVEF